MKKEKKFHSEGLAERAGISKASLSHFEKDRSEPDYETLRKWQISLKYQLII
ncbi:helix-turn-helix domain-containing protein [Halobacillus halophilus]|uniref:helix-turn-helix domain-containing protein n=1 Tax=Halobacillus halophilus TaxID=1570 RepID=UPI001CD607D6|nr:helix-turn-helix transcriptional regulator [Halobacillus halophilus]MCA1011468.1 helix-turn-helix domain-containing protein [Halobacillus halophilus]